MNFQVVKPVSVSPNSKNWTFGSKYWLMVLGRLETVIPLVMNMVVVDIRLPRGS